MAQDISALCLKTRIPGHHATQQRICCTVSYKSCSGLLDHTVASPLWLSTKTAAFLKEAAALSAYSGLLKYKRGQDFQYLAWSSGTSVLQILGCPLMLYCPKQEAITSHQLCHCDNPGGMIMVRIIIMDYGEDTQAFLVTLEGQGDSPSRYQNQVAAAVYQKKAHWARNVSLGSDNVHKPSHYVKLSVMGSVIARARNGQR